MAHRLAGVVGQEVLLGDIGDQGGLLVLGQQVIEGLVLGRAHVLGDRQPPLFGVGEFRVHVENHAAEREEPVAHHLSNRELGDSSIHGPRVPPPG